MSTCSTSLSSNKSDVAFHFLETIHGRMRKQKLAILKYVRMEKVFLIENVKNVLVNLMVKEGCTYV